MSIGSLFLILSGFLNSLIALVVIKRGKNPQVKKFYGALAINVVLWCASIFLFRVLRDPFYVIFWGKVAHIAAIGIAFSLFFFAVYFPYARIKNIKIIFIVLLLLSLVFVSLLIFSDSVIDGFKELNGNNYYKTGYLYLYYGVFITALFLISFLELFIKFLKSRNINRTQIKFVFIGLFISANVGVISNLILPGVGVIKYNWLGPSGTFIMLAFFAYAVVKHHLLNVRVIATEIFSALIAVFVLVDALLSKTTTEFVLKFALFGGVAVFGVLIIKSVLNEIKSREKIAQISEDLRIANIELKRLDQSKSDFLSIASHQLRTPLTAIKGYSSMILEGEFGELTKKVREAVDKVFQSSQRLVLIVDDFLNISRIEAGTMKYEFIEFDLQKITETVVNDFTTNNENAKRLKLKFFTQKADFTVKGDQNKIAQVVSNLVDNSLKYTSSGFVKVFLSAGDSGKTVLLKVQDTGVGISKDTIPRLFQKFSRAEDVSRLHTGGTGLGLYIAKRIIEDHRGRIWAESEGEGKGSTFFVELPRG